MSILVASSILAMASAHALNGVVPVSAQVVSAVAASTVGQYQHFPDRSYAARPGQVRLLGTFATTDPDAHANINGRLWISQPFIGPAPSPAPINNEVPGPGAYGVSEGDQTTILVRIGMTSIGISPWQRIEGWSQRRLEAARLKWLDQHGYGSGVRTFVNDAYTPGIELATAPLQQLPDAQWTEGAPTNNARDIQPRATIRIPSDMPRFRKRMDVRRPGLLPGYRAQPAFVVANEQQAGEVQVRSITGASNSNIPIKVVPSTTTLAIAQ